MNRYKLIISILTIIILNLSVVSASSQNCKYDKYGVENPEFVWSTITYIPKTASQIREKIVDAANESVGETVISVHKINSKGATFVGSFETAYDGKFCFGGLKKGRYFLKIGNKDFQRIEIEINLEPQNKKALKNLIFTLEIGY